MKRKRLLMVQPGLHGDIVVCLPIAKHYHDRGYRVHWPMPAGWTYRSLMDRIPYVRPIFIECHDPGIFGPVYEMADRGGFDRIVDTSAGMVSSRAGYPSPELSFVAYKYRAAGVDMEERYRLTWRRNRRREEELYRRVVGKRDRYCFVHDATWAGRHDFEENGLPFVRFRPIKPYSLFDWYLVVSRAAEIKCIDSSMANWIETLRACLRTPKTVVHRSVFAVNSIFRSNWKVRQGWMPYPPGRIRYDADHRALEIPEDLIRTSPTGGRGGARILVYNYRTAALEHRTVEDLPAVVKTQPVYVNDSSAGKWKIWLQRSTGHRLECSLARKIGRSWIGFIGGAEEFVVEGDYRIADGSRASISEPWEIPGSYVLRFSKGPDLQSFGEFCLPPGIERPADDADWRRRFEAPWARRPGSFFPDSSGARIPEEILRKLRIVPVTQHSDLSCFVHHDRATRPKEFYRCPPRLVTGVAVGFQAAAALEASAKSGKPSGMSDVRIEPPPSIKLCRGILTPFPLLHEFGFMSIQTYTGIDGAWKIYEEAVRKRYYFWLYGDLLLLIG